MAILLYGVWLYGPRIVKRRAAVTAKEGRAQPPCLPLLGPQRLHRIDASGPSGRKPRRESRDERE